MGRVVRLILFDIDGTLIHTRGAGVNAFNKAFANEFNIRAATEGVRFAGRTDASIVREVFAKHQVEPTPELFRRFRDCYVFWLDYLLCRSGGEICPGVWNFLHSVSRLPEPPQLGLLTGNIRLGAEIKLRHFQIWDCFELGAFGDEHEDRNELAAIARRRGEAVLESPLGPGEILVIGDTPHDVRCGQQIEAKTLAVATGPFGVPDLAACQATWAVTDLNGLGLSVRELCA